MDFGLNDTGYGQITDPERYMIGGQSGEKGSRPLKNNVLNCVLCRLPGQRERSDGATIYRKHRVVLVKVGVLLLAVERVVRMNPSLNHYPVKCQSVLQRPLPKSGNCFVIAPPECTVQTLLKLIADDTDIIVGCDGFELGFKRLGNLQRVDEDRQLLAVYAPLLTRERL